MSSLQVLREAVVCRGEAADSLPDQPTNSATGGADPDSYPAEMIARKHTCTYILEIYIFSSILTDCDSVPLQKVCVSLCGLVLRILFLYYHLLTDLLTSKAQ